MDQGTEHPLAEICSTWISIITKGLRHKREKFQDTADECMKFYDGNHNFLYEGGGSKTGSGLRVDFENKIKVPFRMSVNKVAELVQLFGPYLYHRNPNRLATPSRPEVPGLVQQMYGGNPQQLQMMQMQYQQQQAVVDAKSVLMETVLNYTPNELNLQGESRRCVEEALIKGRGCAWTEIYYPPESDSPMIGTFHDDTDNLVTDPDADKAGEWMWIARKVTMPYWEWEQEYGLAPGTLKSKASMSSSEYASSRTSNKAVADEAGHMKRKVGQSNDLVVGWKIYSKMGFGHYLRGAPQEAREQLEQFGRFVYLVIVNGVPYPLNLPPHVMKRPMETQEDIDFLMNQVRWPIPFHADNEWPVTPLDFHNVPGCSWPQAHMKPGLGELKAIDWVMSFIVSKVKVNSRDILAIAEELTDSGVLSITQGEDYEILKLKRSLEQNINQMVQFLQFPPMNKDILTVLEILLAMFERRVGLNELLYGQTETQMRSSAEASLKGDMVQIRINDMAQVTEAWASKIARKEALGNRLFMTGKDVAPMLGEVHDPENQQFGVLSQMWDQFVYVPLQVGDNRALQNVMREFDYRIEAGSVRKPNQQTAIENMDSAAQVMFPNLLGMYQQTGQPQQLNAFLTDWAKARQLDMSAYLFPAFPPPGTPPEAEQDPRMAG